MIKAQFRLASELVEIIVRGNELMFMDVGTGMISTIEGTRLSKAGVLKEHPDLKDNRDWKRLAIERLKAHVKSFKKEMDKLNYVKEELIKFGYEPLNYQRAGFRPQKFKDVQ